MTDYEINTKVYGVKYDLDNHVIAVDGSKFDPEWYRKNYLDHVYAVSDESGDFNEHYRYAAFGEVTIYNNSGTVQSSSQINNQIMWNTRRLDEVSGYYLYKYRHYSPALGRWQMAIQRPD